MSGVTDMNKLIIYNYGNDSSPWSKKPSDSRYTFESPGYREQSDPDKRVGQLLAMMAPSAIGPIRMCLRVMLRKPN